ncbi:CGNR zinc finger domain-containing protein [Micromonospora zamorensis]|uniref:CGNR zinc finger domain-containing protein n=1 Tax=Micromonospora zamorensis TaxID=709883 RepID=UPI003D994D06
MLCRAYTSDSGIEQLVAFERGNRLGQADGQDSDPAAPQFRVGRYCDGRCGNRAAVAAYRARMSASVTSG